MDRLLNISIIGKDKEFVDNFEDAVKNSNIPVKISSNLSDKDFLKKQPQFSPDLIISIVPSKNYDWKYIISELTKTQKLPYIIYLIPDDVDKGLSLQMINAGAYDVIKKKVFNDLPVLINRIARDIEHKSESVYFPTDKNIADHILNYSRSMLTVINRDYRYEQANTRFCNAHHINKDLVVGKSLSEIWGRDNFETNIRKNIDNCFSGKTINYEASFQTPAYGERYFDVSFRPLTTGNEQITHLLAETFDITDIKLTQQAFDEIEKEFKELETNIPIGYLRCDTSGKILHVNKSFLRIMEFDEENELIKMNLKIFYNDENLFKIHLEQILFYKSKIFSRVSLKTGKGKEIPCRITAFLVPQENNKPSYIDLSFEDSTRELILETRLLQAQKLETIGSLAGGIAHDFNNILATIYGYTELILNDITEASPISEKLGKIITAVAKARSLTDQILTFSRQVEQEKIYVSVEKVLKETIDFVKAGAPKNIKITDNVKKTDAFVFADPTQLFRVFLNLMTNSVQAMEGHDGKLIVDLSLIEGKFIKYELNKDIVADEYALITLKDTGIGMDPSLVNRIFEPFFTTRDVGKGTGLGLSVVHGIISEIEGEILVSSKKDHGTTFYVYFPISKHSPSKKTISKGAKEILFVSGNNHESRILSLALENSGYKLVFISDYGRLFKILKDAKQLPDLIIFMDDTKDFDKNILIDTLSGEKLNIPVLLISDYDHCFLDEKLVNSGIIRQQLIKPVSLKEVRSAIQISLRN